VRLLRVLPVLALILLAAMVRAEEGASAAQQRPNFLIVVADDVGTDHIGIYGKAASPGPTPNIDRLGRHGLVFTGFWAMPSCSPRRAALLTGLYPGRTGIGSSVRPKPRRGVEGGPERIGLSEAIETLRPTGKSLW
jgi:arylsulfatase A-like enzyme